MAEGKKSFILYCDQRGIFNKLTDEQAGVLIKHIFAYVADENPTADFVTELAFEAIKTQLKRDLKTWEAKQEQRKEAGRRSAEARLKALESVKRNLTVVDNRPTVVDGCLVSSTVNGNGNVNVNGNGNVNEKKSNRGVTAPPPSIEEVIAYFKQNGYTELSARKAWEYYNASMTESSRVWRDGKGQTVKNWKQKMQAVWFKDENKDVPREPWRPKDPTF